MKTVDQFNLVCPPRPISRIMGCKSLLHQVIVNSCQHCVLKNVQIKPPIMYAIEADVLYLIPPLQNPL